MTKEEIEWFELVKDIQLGQGFTYKGRDYRVSGFIHLTSHYNPITGERYQDEPGSMSGYNAERRLHQGFLADQIREIFNLNVKADRPEQTANK